MKDRKYIALTAGLILVVLAGVFPLGWYMGVHTRVISRSEASAIALAYLGSGEVINSRMVRSGSAAVWEVNIAEPGKPGFTEICIHAQTKSVISVRNESVEKANRELSSVAKKIGITVDKKEGKKPGTKNDDPPSQPTVEPNQQK